MFNYPDLDGTVMIFYEVLFHTFALIAKFDFPYIYCNPKMMPQFCSKQRLDTLQMYK